MIVYSENETILEAKGVQLVVDVIKRWPTDGKCTGMSFGIATNRSNYNFLRVLGFWIFNRTAFFSRWKELTRSTYSMPKLRK